VNLSVRKIEVFLHVARLESVSKTADELRLSQSAVSMSLSGMEKDAGGQLFKRIGKRMLLNEKGRAILPEAERAFEALSKLDAMLSTNEELLGELRIGASTTIGNYLLPLVMADFARENPGIRVSLRVGNTAQMTTELAGGFTDLALVEGPVHIHSLDVTPWKDDELVVIAAPGHDWLKKRQVTPSMLAQAGWIMREKGSGTREVFEKAMTDCGLQHGIQIELGHTEAIKKAVEAGLGVSCLSRLAVTRELEQGWLAEVRTPLKLKRTLSLVTNARTGGSRILNACVRFLTRQSA
jgi:DNA-binding transcriptional LysR family regulator